MRLCGKPNRSSAAADSKAIIWAVGMVLYCSAAGVVNAASEKTWFTDNLRYSIDASSRSLYFGNRDALGFQHALGVDMHKVFSNDDGDYGTLILQGYLTRIDNLPVYPGFFDDAHDTEFVYRIATFNYTGFKGLGLGQHLPNIRIGHLELPFGLEHTINTNGTLRDYGSGRNLGLKADWGITLNQEENQFEYEFSASSGGGQEIDSNRGSYVYVGRIGTLRERNQVYGLSIYNAKIGGVRRERIGVDAQWYHGLHGVFADLSAGQNGNTDIVNTLLEWNLRNRNEMRLIYVQLQYFGRHLSGGWDNNVAAVAGVLYLPSAHWDISGQLKQDLTQFSGAVTETMLSLQIRYRL